jgi:outer membrane protein TolC
MMMGLSWSLPMLFITVMIPGTAWSQRETPLREFLSLVERTNPALRSASLEPNVADADLQAALGRFDPFLAVNYESKFKSGQDKLTVLEGAIEQPLDMLFGPKIKAAYQRGSGLSINPEDLTAGAGEASLAVSLPLLQGVFTDARRNQLRKAELRPDAAKAQFTIERNALLRAAALRYIDWSEAVENVYVADTLLGLSKQRQDLIVKRSVSGESAMIDSTEGSQEVRRREGEQLRTLRIAEQLGIEVNGLVFSDGLRTFDRTIERPAGLTGKVDSVRSVQNAISIAYAARPELRRAQLSLQAARLDSGLAREFMRPNLEFDAGLVALNAASPGSLDYKLGLRMQQPLLFRQASAGVQTTSIAVDRAEFALQMAERVVEVDVRNALIALERSIQRRVIAEEEVRLALIMVNAEQRRFSAGDASLLTVNLRERFYGEALQRLVSAKADVERANIVLLWAMGVI